MVSHKDGIHGLGIKEYYRGIHLREALIGRLEEDSEIVTPGLHAYNGSYTALKIVWRGIELNVETAHDGDDLVILVTPLKKPKEKCGSYG